MNYNLEQRIIPSQIQYNLDVAMPYGDMGNDPLMAKFEETLTMDDGENAYETYGRGVLTDRRPDEPLLASEEPRKSTNNTGYLNLLHYGGRGEYNEPRHPELFLEMTDKDPRGIATDPDFRKYVDKVTERLKLVRFYADADNSITGGGWSPEASSHAARATVQRLVAPRMKIFYTEKDGKRTGLRHDPKHVSPVGFIQDTHRFGDMIKDFALNPMRKTEILSNQIYRNSRMYSMFTTDHEYTPAYYGETHRRGRLQGKQNSPIIDYNGELSNNDSDNSRMLQAVGIIMGSVVNQRKVNALNDTNLTDVNLMGGGDETQIRRNEVQLKRDLTTILRAIQTSSDFAGSDPTQTRRQPVPHKIVTRVGKELEDAEQPTALLLTASKMYKSVDPEKYDMSVARHNQINTGFASTDDTQTRKLGENKVNSTPGKESHIEVDGMVLNTANYKTAAGFKRKANAAKYEGENQFSASDNAQARSTLHKGYRVTTTNDINPDTSRQFNDNTQKDRFIAPMGSKYMMRGIRNEAKQLGESFTAE